MRKLLQDSEDLDMDALWQAADMYKAAIVLTRDNDIADEAKACSKCAPQLSESRAWDDAATLGIPGLQRPLQGPCAG